MLECPGELPLPWSSVLVKYFLLERCPGSCTAFPPQLPHCLYFLPSFRVLCWSLISPTIKRPPSSLSPVAFSPQGLRPWTSIIFWFPPTSFHKCPGIAPRPNAPICSSFGLWIHTVISLARLGSCIASLSASFWITLSVFFLFLEFLYALLALSGIQSLMLLSLYLRVTSQKSGLIISTCLGWFVLFRSAFSWSLAEEWNCMWHFTPVGVTFLVVACNCSFLFCPCCHFTCEVNYVIGACLSLSCSAVRSSPFKFSVNSRRISLAFLRSMQKTAEIAVLSFEAEWASSVNSGHVGWWTCWFKLL